MSSEYEDEEPRQDVVESETTVEGSQEISQAAYVAMTRDFPIIKKKIFTVLKDLITINTEGLSFLEAAFDSNVNMNVAMVSHFDKQSALYMTSLRLYSIATLIYDTLWDNYIEFEIPFKQLSRIESITMVIMYPIDCTYRRPYSDTPIPCKSIVQGLTTITRDRGRDSHPTSKSNLGDIVSNVFFKKNR